LRVPLLVPFALNLNGNAITISNGLFLEMVTRLGHAPEGPVDAARALGEIVRQRRLKGAEPLTFGMVFPFSTHAYLLRHWLRLGGIHPDEDVHIVVVPPPYMGESLRNGLLNGFCVGSPWNGLAVQAQAGRIVALGVDIARCAPEKVLAIPEPFADSDPASVFALIRALRAAALWCEQPGNRAELAALLSQERYLGVDKSIIRDTLEGDLCIAANGLRRADSDFLILGRQSTNRPDSRHAQWLYAEMAGAGQTIFTEEKYIAAAAVYRPDLYDAATGETHRARGENAVAMKIGSGFEEHDAKAYLATIGR
jgi:NitT/TauT family transport system ATP-binding protein